MWGCGEVGGGGGGRWVTGNGGARGDGTQDLAHSGGADRRFEREPRESSRRIRVHRASRLL